MDVLVLVLYCSISAPTVSHQHQSHTDPPDFPPRFVMVRSDWPTSSLVDIDVEAMLDGTRYEERRG